MLVNLTYSLKFQIYSYIELNAFEYIVPAIKFDDCLLFPFVAIAKQRRDKQLHVRIGAVLKRGKTINEYIKKLKNTRANSRRPCLSTWQLT